MRSETKRRAPCPAAVSGRRRTGGYNLIEISLACFILAIGLVSILAVFPVAIGLAGKAVDRSLASSAMSTIIDQLEQYGREPGFRAQQISFPGGNIHMISNFGKSSLWYRYDYPTATGGSSFRIMTVSLYGWNPTDLDNFDTDVHTMATIKAHILSVEPPGP